ncbi:hypothetical protein ACIBIZ_25030 [Nonomuraea spiralis]|uniref:Uncharacterized protein n=1 Tax=Nonomuraea spiralis TaxID=46182 RepID=A0ABV5IGY7_9ACTN|nr:MULTISPECIES: hypothetical protein [Nonomuraea]RSN10489.1 hypothetical protein DMB42_16430 [Nonomuraea sp. WAC 01424]GGS72028.1 hypothetical protein GCM10010176_013830 [Nonomuraea spiralis]
MKANLIVAGGFAVAALFGMAGAANANVEDHSEKCGWSASDDSTGLHITPWGVSATHHDDDDCEHREHARPYHHGFNYGYWPGRSYWPGIWAGAWGGV